jgi:DnaJ-class molecular chaperone
MPEDSGRLADRKHKDPKTCSWCGGTGKITTIQDGKEKTETCPHCGGTGQVR